MLRRMNRSLKTFLLWLLIAALPLQGFAAAVQLRCGPTHHEGVAMVDMEAHHHEDNAGHSHDGDDEVTHHSAFAVKASTSDTSLKHQHASCSACAACCVGAGAPPSSSPMTPAHSSSESFVISQTPLVDGFIPAGLERPPKHIFA